MNFQYVANYTAEVSDRILIALYSLLFKKLISKSTIIVKSKNILVNIFHNLGHDCSTYLKCLFSS